LPSCSLDSSGKVDLFEGCQRLSVRTASCIFRLIFVQGATGNTCSLPHMTGTCPLLSGDILFDLGQQQTLLPGERETIGLQDNPMIASSEIFADLN
jgi:hypothetical protein